MHEFQPPRLRKLIYGHIVSDAMDPSWDEVQQSLLSLQHVIQGLLAFTQQRVVRKQDILPLHNPKYKTNMCRDVLQKGKCPRGTSCTFAHSPDEMEKLVFEYRTLNVL